MVQEAPRQCRVVDLTIRPLGMEKYGEMDSWGLGDLDTLPNGGRQHRRFLVDEPFALEFAGEGLQLHHRLLEHVANLLIPVHDDCGDPRPAEDRQIPANLLAKRLDELCQLLKAAEGEKVWNVWNGQMVRKEDVVLGRPQEGRRA